MSILAEPLGPDDHVLGRRDAPATLVEYGDYECPFCGRAEGEVEEVVRRVGNAVRFAFRHFPFTQLHPHALLAAQAAEAAGAQGAFWRMHALLYANQDALDLQDLLAYAGSLGLDVDRFIDELRAGIHLPKVQHDFETGLRSGVKGIPTFFVNGYRHERGWDASALVAAIDRAVREQGIAARKTYP